jgi:hypothetical protein
MTVPEPIVIGCAPWKVAVSEMVVVGWTERGARGRGAAAGVEDPEDEDDTTRWREVDVAEGGFRNVDGAVFEDMFVVVFILRVFSSARN